MLWEGGRSKGTGVVQFATIEEAETAISACLPTPLHFVRCKADVL